MKAKEDSKSFLLKLHPWKTNKFVPLKDISCRIIHFPTINFRETENRENDRAFFVFSSVNYFAQEDDDLFVKEGHQNFANLHHGKKHNETCKMIQEPCISCLGFWQFWLGKLLLLLLLLLFPAHFQSMVHYMNAWMGEFYVSKQRYIDHTLSVWGMILLASVACGIRFAQDIPLGSAGSTVDGRNPAKPPGM